MNTLKFTYETNRGETSPSSIDELLYKSARDSFEDYRSPNDLDLVEKQVEESIKLTSTLIELLLSKGIITESEVISVVKNLVPWGRRDTLKIIIDEK